MVKLDHFTVQVIQDDETDRSVAANEYDDPYAGNDDNEVTKYVEIKEDKNFKINISIDADFELDGHDALDVSITIDGQQKDGIVYSRLAIGRETVRTIEGFQRCLQGQQKLQLFRFEETTTRPTNAGELVEDLQEQFEDQGTLRLEFARVSGYSSPARLDSDQQHGPIRFPKDIVKEKGSTSRAGFESGTARPVTYRNFVTTCREPTVATFQLKYRTIESLWDQEIVPRPPKITSNTVIVIPDDQTELDPRAEMERLKRIHEAEVENLRQQIKLERAEGFRAALDRKRKIVPTCETGEIDLTEERPAHRRKPSADDVVIELDD